MTVRLGLVTERAEMALLVAGVAASAGAQVLRIDRSTTGPEVPALVLVDAMDDSARGALAVRGGHPPGPGGGDWGEPRGAAACIVVHLGGEALAARSAAEEVGADHVVELPAGGSWLAQRLVPARPRPILAVLGAVGGAGATTVSIACAAGAGPDCLLVDADPLSVGMDLALGLPEATTGRWSAVPQTTQPLVEESFRAAFPVLQDVTVVTGPSPAASDDRVANVLRVGREHFRRTVVDLGREPSAVAAGDLVVIVAPATLAGVVASRRLLDRLPTDRVLVGVRPTAWLSARDAGEQLGVAFRELPRLARAAEMADCGDLLGGRTGRAMRHLGGQIWADLA